MPLDQPPGPSGVAATALLVGGLFVVGLIVIALGLIGGWIGFAIAIFLMIFGVFSLGRYVQRLTRNGSPTEASRRDSESTDDRSSITDDPQEKLSPRDAPLDSPAHREAARRLHENELEGRPLLAGQLQPKR